MTPPTKKGKAPSRKKEGPITVYFTRERETKGTQRFEEEGPADARSVGYLYVKKAADVALGSPERIEVTITPAS